MNNSKKRTLRIGAYSIGLTAIAVAVIVVLNLFVSQLPAAFTRFDMTGDALLTFGDETKKLVSQLDEEVTMYHICQDGYEDVYVEELLARYQEENSKIKVEKIDPVKKPTFVKEYTDLTVSDNSVIVVSEKRDYVVDGSQMYMYEPVGAEGQFLTAYSYQQYADYYANYYGQDFPVTPYFFGEKELTGAIDYVMAEKLPVVYQVEGHGETAFGSIYATYTEDENVEMKPLTILSGEVASVPQDAEVVFINAPERDISEAEYTALTKYLEAGGNVVLTTAYDLYSEEKTPNLVKLTAFMGLKGTSDLLEEGDMNHYYQYPFYMIPDIEANGVAAELAEGYTFLCINCHPIEAVEAENRTTAPLFKTSETAYLYSQLEGKESIEGIEGAQYSYAYQSTIADEETGKTAGTLVWFGSPLMFEEQVISMGGANVLLYSSMLSQMCEKTISINVAAKEITSATLSVTASDSLVGIAVYVIIIPLAFLVAGFVVWFIRRRK